MTCSVEGCEKGGKLRRGWCNNHYGRWTRHGSPTAGRVPNDPGQRCSIEGCYKPLKGHSLCAGHLWRKNAGKDMEAPHRSQLLVTSSAGAHQRVYSLWGSASQYSCISCPASAQDWAYDGSDPGQLLGIVGRGRGVEPSAIWFSSWPEFYAPMCRKCHRTKDARSTAQELRQYREWRASYPDMSLPTIKQNLRLIECA